MNAACLLVRFIDAFGFRYRWATEGLSEDDLLFQACDTSMSLGELLVHIQGLISATDAFIMGNEREKIAPTSLEEIRRKTLSKTVKTREALLTLDDDYLGKRRYDAPWDQEE